MTAEHCVVKVRADGQLIIQTYKLPSLDFHKVATRFQLPVRAVAFSPCGLKLAAAGDDDGIKLVHVADGKVNILKVQLFLQHNSLAIHKIATVSVPYSERRLFAGV